MAWARLVRRSVLQVGQNSMQLTSGSDKAPSWPKRSHPSAETSSSRASGRPSWPAPIKSSFIFR